MDASMDKELCDRATDLTMSSLNVDDGGATALSMPTTRMSIPADSDIDCELDTEELVSLNLELDVLLDPKNTLSTPPPSINLSPFECTRLQQEEVETLSSIYGEDMRCLNDCHSCFVIDVKFLTDEIKAEDVIKIWFSLPPNYPSVPPVFELESSLSGVCSYNDADELYDLFVTESFKRIGEMMIFDLVTIAQEFMTSLVERKKRVAEERAAADLKRKQEIEFEDALKRPKPIPKELVGDFEEAANEDSDNHIKTDDSGEVESTRDVSHKVDSLLWSEAVLKPTQFIGRISEIIKCLPDGLQVTRIENVLRQDLAQRFCQTIKQVNESLWKHERKYPHEFNLKPQIAFHGTLSSFLPSIVQRGLVIPGESTGVRVRCGSSLGRGIYLSPSAQFSLGYSCSNRLIVCAAILGRIYKEGAKESRAPHSNYNSVVSSCEQEWVFFKAGQVLPCYVIQVVDKGPSHPKKPQPPPLSSLVQNHHEDEDDGSVRDKKSSLMARARKFLPYGFGPGAKTVIEDAASFDDDEEDYGEYQELRHVDADKHFLVESSELQQYRYKY